MRFGKKELVLLNLVCIATAVVWHHLRRCEDIRMPPDLEYDYIVVGAGTAGSVLARRLLDNAVGTDDGPAQVLLIEAGRGEAPWYASVPLLSMALQATSIDWHFFTAPQKDALQCYNNQTHQRGLGRVESALRDVRAPGRTCGRPVSQAGVPRLRWA